MPIIEVKKIFVSALALINEENEILIGKRSSDNHYSGLWEFPGGKVELFETPEDALIREISEEIDIDLKRNCIAPLNFSTYKYKDSYVIILLYIARKWNKSPRPKVHSEIMWVKAKELRKFEMLPANNYFISSLQDLLE